MMTAEQNIDYSPGLRPGSGNPTTTTSTTSTTAATHTPRCVDSPRGTAPRDQRELSKMAAIAGSAATGTEQEQRKPSLANAEPYIKTNPDDVDDDPDSGDGEEQDDDEENDTKNKVMKSEGDDDKKASKKSRRELPAHTVAILKGWMLSPEHVKHPYPTDEDKQMLLKKTGINMKQLTNWFTNARKRIWKPMMRREHSRQLQTAMEFEKARGVREPYGAVPPGPYRDNAVPMYPPRAGVRHSFDAGSLGAPPPMPRADHPPHYQSYDHQAAPPPVYPVAPASHMAYPPRAARSISESSAHHEEYMDPMRMRKRAHEDTGEVDLHNDKRYRRATSAVMSPRGLKILQDWVAAHSHMEYPLPADSDKLQLSRDTGLDVQQIELWFKNNVGRFGAPVQAPSAVTPQHGHPPAYRSTPSRDNPMYPPPPAYGERRSIPSQGNPMFPPRPAASARASIPVMGNPQFPPPPAVRRDTSGGAYPGHGYPPQPPDYDAEPRAMRSLSINAGHYPIVSGLPAPTPSIPAPIGAPGAALPSLTRQIPGRPTMGQARDGRSHTLDMGVFADARRRSMNFQDILASTASRPTVPAMTGANGSGGAAPRRPSIPSLDVSNSANAENVYPTNVLPSHDVQKGGFEQAESTNEVRHDPQASMDRIV